MPSGTEVRLGKPRLPVELVSDTVGSLLTAPLDPLAILGLAVSVVVGLAAITRLSANRWREHQEWATLDLG